MRHFILEKTSFIADQLVAAGSRLTDAHLFGSEPGGAWIETDERGIPLDPADTARLLAVGINLGPVQVSPVQPHAPNPTQPQAIPAQEAGGVQLVGNRSQYVPGDGVESNEAASARVERLKAELAAAEEAADAAADVDAAPLPPVRRGSAAPADDAGEPGPLDGSIPDLEKHLAEVDDKTELQKLRDAEVAGKSRTGAIAAIDARFAELNA